jgi:hypothetical protein
MRVYESRVSYGVVCLKIYVSSTDQAELRYPTTHSQLLFNRNLRRTESSHTNKYCKSRIHLHAISILTLKYLFKRFQRTFFFLIPGRCRSHYRRRCSGTCYQYETTILRLEGCSDASILRYTSLVLTM